MYLKDIAETDRTMQCGDTRYSIGLFKDATRYSDIMETHTLKKIYVKESLHTVSLSYFDHFNLFHL